MVLLGLWQHGSNLCFYLDAAFLSVHVFRCPYPNNGDNVADVSQELLLLEDFPTTPRGLSVKEEALAFLKARFPHKSSPTPFSFLSESRLISPPLEVLRNSICTPYPKEKYL